MRSVTFLMSQAVWLIPLSILISPAAAQEGSISRISQGDFLGIVNGEPRFRENSGWDQSGHLTDWNWAFQYDTELGGGEPWTVVVQGDRANNGLSVSANELTLDLNGHTYQLGGYLSQPGGVFQPSFLNVSGQESGASLRVTNGTLDFTRGFGFLRVGQGQSAGMLIVEDAAIQASTVLVGADTASPGTVILRQGGTLESGGSRDIKIGVAADGTVRLVGPGSKLIATGGFMKIGNAANAAVGQLIVNDPDARVQVAGQLIIDNPAPTPSHPNVGLTIHAGRVDVGRLTLTPGSGSGNSYGAVLIDGGTLHVSDSVGFNGGSGRSQIFLQGGELEVARAGLLEFGPAESGEFFWKRGTLRYTTGGTTLSRSQIVNLTKQGALSYQGNRAAGTIATGQTLAFATTGTLHGGEIGIAGGTIAAGETVRIYNDSTLSGYGTIDAALIGDGAVISSEANQVLAIGALGGSATLSGQGVFQVGHLGIDASYGGIATGSGGFHKVGGGVQTITGSLLNTGGIFVEEGTLAIDGAAAGITAPQVAVATSGHLQFLSGATGNASIVNNGWLTNNGVITGDVTGSGYLSGTGRIEGIVDILGGGVLAPGNSVESMTVSNLTLHGGSTLAVEIAAAEGIAGQQWDLTVVEQSLQVLATASNPVIVALQTLAGGGLAGPLADFDPSAIYSWQIIAANLADPQAWSSDLFFVDATGFENLAPGQVGDFSVSSAADGFYLNYNGLQPAAVPEPSGALLLGLFGIVLLLVRCHRRRCRAVNRM